MNWMNLNPAYEAKKKLLLVYGKITKHTKLKKPGNNDDTMILFNINVSPGRKCPDGQPPLLGCLLEYLPLGK